MKSLSGNIPVTSRNTSFCITLEPNNLENKNGVKITATKLAVPYWSRERGTYSQELRGSTKTQTNFGRKTPQNGYWPKNLSKLLQNGIFVTNFMEISQRFWPLESRSTYFIYKVLKKKTLKMFSGYQIGAHVNTTKNRTNWKSLSTVWLIAILGFFTRPYYFY